MKSVEQRLRSLVPKNALMAMAWYGSLRWALGEEGARQAFAKETGLNWTPGRTPLEKMIDDATGIPADYILKFAKWHNQTIWGEDAHGKAIDIVRVKKVSSDEKVSGVGRKRDSR